MMLGRSVTLAKPGSFAEYAMQVVEATSQLFYLLEAAECIETQFTTGARQHTLHDGFGPSALSIQLSSTVRNTQHTWASEYGAEGRLVQLAYLGWLATVDGAWEKYRTNPPWEKNRALRLGQEADLFGDLHKIRNDALKNRAIAQRKNTGKCVCLNWFAPGDQMHFRLDHVLDFLHRLGGYMRNLTAGDGVTSANWHIKSRIPACPQPHRVVSSRVFVEAFPTDSRVPGFGLFVSMIFADGICWVVEADRADTRDELRDHLKALNAAPKDKFGVPIDPRLGRMDVLGTYAYARKSVFKGEVPFDAGSPWIHFREPEEAAIDVVDSPP